MAATPTFSLSDGSNTVTLEWANAPEQFAEPTEEVAIQIRAKLDGGSGNPGFVNIVKSDYTIAGQSMTTLHRHVTPAQHAQLSAWNRDKDALVWTGSVKGSNVQHSCIIQVYQFRPRNVAHHWNKSYRVEDLTLFFVGDE